MRFAVSILLFWCGFVGANPVVYEGNPFSLPGSAYIAYERLAVEISPTEACFQGTFVFRVRPTVVSAERKYIDADLQIPVWFPMQGDSDPSVTNFWRVFAMEGYNRINTFQQRKAFEEGVGMTVIVGNKPHHSIGGFQATLGPEEHPPQLPREPGLCRLWCYGMLSREDIKSGLPVKIHYRQPLCQSGEGGRFHYVPVFLNLPAGASTEDIKSYAITLTTTPDCALSVSNGEQKFKVGPGASLTLHPRHLRPIRALVTKDLIDKGPRQ